MPWIDAVSLAVNAHRIIIVENISSDTWTEKSFETTLQYSVESYFKYIVIVDLFSFSFHEHSFLENFCLWYS